MKAMIRGYENRPGEHCGSSAMRNLIHHYCKLDLSEAVIFGLGSGIDFLLLETAEFEPGVLVFGRSATLEPDVAAASVAHRRLRRRLRASSSSESQPPRISLLPAGC